MTTSVSPREDHAAFPPEIWLLIFRFAVPSQWTATVNEPHVYRYVPVTNPLSEVHGRDELEECLAVRFPLSLQLRLFSFIPDVIHVDASMQGLE